MAEFALIAVAKSHGPSRVKALELGFPSAQSADSNLQLRPRRQCIQQSFRYGSGLWPCTTCLIQARVYRLYIGRWGWNPSEDRMETMPRHPRNGAHRGLCSIHPRFSNTGLQNKDVVC